MQTCITDCTCPSYMHAVKSCQVRQEAGEQSRCNGWNVLEAHGTMKYPRKWILPPYVIRTNKIPVSENNTGCITCKVVLGFFCPPRSFIWGRPAMLNTVVLKYTVLCQQTGVAEKTNSLVYHPLLAEKRKDSELTPKMKNWSLVTIRFQ